MKAFSIALIVLALSAAVPAAAQEGISYVLSFPDKTNHYVDVEATYPTAGRDSVEVMMAVWTPGSYLVREFSRHVEGVRAESQDGATLPVEKTRKNRWRIETQGSERAVLRYRVYCREMTVRTNWVESDFAILNGAPTFMTLVDGLELEHDTTVVLPEDWKQTWAGMPAHPDGAPHHFVARDFDEVVDSPIYAGNPATYEFEVDGKQHVLVNQGEGGIWDGPRSAADVETIVEENLAFWGFLPYDRYVFFNMITEAGGGLEHKNSTLMMTSRWRGRDPEQYRRWLGLVSHEYFHAWNVKRLRPKPLGPFDYENEVHSKSLWIAEGVTSYYDDLLLKRSGLFTKKQYLRALSGQIETLQTTPGREVRPLELSSFDSWIKAYRPDENSSNTTISYYTKGAVVGFLLDAKIRQDTGGEKSLDDVMRMAYELYSGESGYTPTEFRAVASEISGTDLSAWFETALETTDELDYAEALAWYGLRFKEPNDEKHEDEDVSSSGWLGLETRDDGGKLVVSVVRRDTPGYTQGFNVGDEILAVDNFRVDVEAWEKRLEQYGPGDEAAVLVARRDALRTIHVTFGEKPPKKWRLEVHPNATSEQRDHLRDWLGAENDAGAECGTSIRP